MYWKIFMSRDFIECFLCIRIHIHICVVHVDDSVYDPSKFYLCAHVLVYMCLCLHPYTRVYCTYIHTYEDLYMKFSAYTVLSFYELCMHLCVRMRLCMRIYVYAYVHLHFCK